MKSTGLKVTNDKSSFTGAILWLCHRQGNANFLYGVVLGNLHTDVVPIKILMSLHSVKEFMDFTGRIIVERTRARERASVKEQGR